MKPIADLVIKNETSIEFTAVITNSRFNSHVKRNSSIILRLVHVFSLS